MKYKFEHDPRLEGAIYGYNQDAPGDIAPSGAKPISNVYSNITEVSIEGESYWGIEPPEPNKEQWFENHYGKWCYLNGKPYSSVGPAYLGMHGVEAWYNIDGKRHRLDGPALIRGENDIRYFIDGNQYSEEEYPNKVKEYIVSSLISKTKKTPQFTIKFEGETLVGDEAPTKDKEQWFRNAECKRCFLNGELHCSTGPAVVYFNGIRAWYQHGVLSRFDGPAVETNDGHDSFYIDGVEYTKEEFDVKLAHSQSLATDNTLTEDPVMPDATAGLTEYIFGDYIVFGAEPPVKDKEQWFYWGSPTGPKACFLNGELHCSTGPAVIHGTSRSWAKRGKYHRLDGPAVISEKYRYYAIEGVFLSEEEFNTQVKALTASKEVNATTKTEPVVAKQLYSVITNSDLTEGKGYPVCIALCELRSTANRLAEGNGVHGSPANVVGFNVLVQNGIEYIALRAVPVTKPSELDIQEGRMQALIDKMKADGYTQEDIDLLSQFNA